MDKREQFFYANAGYSYDPKTQSREEGRRECARRLARAERWAREAGYCFEWQLDPDADYADWPQWECLMRDDTGGIVQSLCGIDFAHGRGPINDPYRSVVEAQLAVQEAPQNLHHDEENDDA